jgi:hypothetical protein
MRLLSIFHVCAKKKDTRREMGFTSIAQALPEWVPDWFSPLLDYASDHGWSYSRDIFSKSMSRWQFVKLDSFVEFSIFDNGISQIITVDCGTFSRSYDHLNKKFYLASDFEADEEMFISVVHAFLG